VGKFGGSHVSHQRHDAAGVVDSVKEWYQSLAGKRWWTSRGCGEENRR
jgi:hypothetical protein